MTKSRKRNPRIESALTYMFGFTAIGATNDETVERPYSPELRAFFAGATGECMKYERDTDDDRVKATAKLLREIADYLDPPEVE